LILRESASKARIVRDGETTLSVGGQQPYFRERLCGGRAGIHSNLGMTVGALSELSLKDVEVCENIEPLMTPSEENAFVVRTSTSFAETTYALRSKLDAPDGVSIIVARPLVLDGAV